MAAWRPTEIETVKELAAKGVSAQRIAIRTRRKVDSVRKLAKELGVTLKTQAEQRKSFGLRSRYSGDELVDHYYETGRS
jgi:hypothetical protein